MITKIAFGVAGLAIAATTVFAEGHIDPAIAKAIKIRKSHMQLNGHNIGILGAMAKGDVAYDAAAASAAAANLVALATMSQAGYWPQGSDAEANEGETTALAKMWDNFPDVSAKAGDLVTATQAMATAAGTDLASLQAAMGTVGGSCNECHKAYRVPRN